MNKYLLLRDNKESGPWSVEELAGKGIKAYDLVWLEGKSAAWRYPSEIAELKPYSPVTEEQPFDRFYKKPELVEEKKPVIAAVPVSDYARFEPEIEEIPAPFAVKKVYVNFPGRVSDVPQKLEKRAENRLIPSAEMDISAKQKETVTPVAIFPPAKSQSHKFLYAAIGACLILTGLITAFIVNSNTQKRSINELNAIVQQMEQRTVQEQQQASALPVVNAQEPPAETPVSREEVNTKKQIIEDPVINTTVKKDIQKQQQASPLPSPVVKPAREETSAAVEEKKSSASAHENLFKLVSLTSNKYKTGVLGGISNLQLELTNNSLLELHKVAVEIKYLGPEKKIVRTQTVYFENVSPGAQVQLDIPKSNRGVTVDYTITDIKS